MSKVHVFGDEAGDLTLDSPGRPGVSRYLIIGTVAMDDCSIAEDLLSLRRELAWGGVQLEGFHATSDRQWVRDRVFEIIGRHDLRFDATVLDKATAESDGCGTEPLDLYRLAWHLHFKRVASETVKEGDNLLVTASSLKIKRRRTAKAAVQRAVEEVVVQLSPTENCLCAFAQAKSDPCLQVADYLTWAVQRKHERGDSRSYEQIKHLIASERSYFQQGAGREALR